MRQEGTACTVPASSVRLHVPGASKVASPEVRDTSRTFNGARATKRNKNHIIEEEHAAPGGFISEG